MAEYCDISETIALDNAESARLLPSEEGVLDGLPLICETPTDWPMARELGGELTENLFEVKMSISEWVISSTIAL